MDSPTLKNEELPSNDAGLAAKAKQSVKQNNLSGKLKKLTKKEKELTSKENLTQEEHDNSLGVKEKELPAEVKELPAEDSNLLVFFTDFTELDKAKEQNNKLDKEILTLRNRVRSLDTERQSLLETVESLQKIQSLQIQPLSPSEMDHLKPSFQASEYNWEPNQQNDVQQQQVAEAPIPSVRKKKPVGSSGTLPKVSNNQDTEPEQYSSDPSLQTLGYDFPHAKSEELHKRCHHEINRLESKNHELQRRMHKLQQELEQVTFKKETLESTIEEYQNRFTDGRHSTDCEKEVMKARITSMETDYAKLKRKYKELKAKSHEVINATSKEQDIQEHVRMNSEAMDTMQLSLDEEIKRREYIEAALATSQQSRTREKEELEAFKTQVHYLNLELNEYREAANLNQKLNQALERMKMENHAQEQKLNKVLKDYTELSKIQNEMPNSNLKDTLEQYTSQIAELKSTISKLQEALGRSEKEKGSAHNQMTEPSDKRLECMQQQLCALLQENQQLKQENIIFRQQLSNNQQGSHMLNQETATMRQQLISFQQENKQLTQENNTIRQQLVNSQQENQRLNQEVRQIQKQMNDLIRSKEKVEENINQVQMQALKMEVSQMQSCLDFEQQNSCQQKQSLEMQLDEANNRAKSQEAMLQQHTEESRQLRQDLQRVHNLCGTAEKELKYKRDQLMELQKQNSLLDQENIRVNLEFKTVQCRLSELDKHSLMLKSECEIKQQRVKELELESGKTFHISKQLKSVQDELLAEKNRTICAEKRTAELQQHLCGIQHQLRLSEARSKEREALDTELMESRDAAAKLKNHLHEEQLQRKLADQNADELQQQIKAMQEKEGCLSRGKCDMQQALQQQDIRLKVLEEEKDALFAENLCDQNTNKKLLDDLCTHKQEIEKLKEELQNLLRQLDSQVRMYNEKQVRHKQKLRKAKEIFIREVMLRDGKIKHLESELKLMKNLMDKEHAWNMKVTYENDLLLVEKRELLQQLNEQEDVVRNNKSVVCSVKHRSSSCGAHTPMGASVLCSATRIANEQVQRKSQRSASRINYLEEENKQLQGETVKLSDRLGTLERSLRILKTDPGKSQHHESLSVSFPQDTCTYQFNDGSAVTGNHLPSTRELSLPGGSNNFSPVDSNRNGKSLDGSDAPKSIYTSSRSQQSELGYLNLTSSRYRDQEDGRSLGSDEV